MDFKLRTYRLQQQIESRENDIRKIEHRIEELSTHKVKAEDDVAYLIQEIRDIIKETQGILVDVQETFKDLGLIGVYDLFSDLFFCGSKIN